MALSFASLSSLFPILHKSTTHNFNSRCTRRTFALNYASKAQPETSRPNKPEPSICKKVQVPNQIELEVLYDDGFGTASVKDYLRAAKDIVKDDGGPPRWFSPIECGRPVVKNAPLLLFLPGSDGVGLGLILHHKSLGKAFEVRCLHIPMKDRTSFEGLINTVERCIESEHSINPSRPIYLVGESFGGCLALAVAARNPTIDLVLVLVNPATSFDRSSLWLLFPFLEIIPSNLHVTLHYILSLFMGAMYRTKKKLHVSFYLDLEDNCKYNYDNEFEFACSISRNIHRSIETPSLNVYGESIVYMTRSLLYF